MITSSIEWPVDPTVRKPIAIWTVGLTSDDPISPRDLARAHDRSVDGPGSVVGSDGMSTIPYQDWAELVARVVVGRELGVEIEEWDKHGRQGVPDLRFLRPDSGGREGFVEVTSVADTAMMSGREAYRKLDTLRPVSLKQSYVVWVDPRIPLMESKRHLEVIVQAMDQHSGSSVASVLDLLPASTARWYADLPGIRSLRIARWSGASEPGMISVVGAAGRGGRVPSVVDPSVLIIPTIDDALRRDAVSRRLAKLKRTGNTEQHLFVVVQDDMWGWEAWWFIASQCTEVPTVEPEVPAHLDGLWLFSGLNRSVLRWMRRKGWGWVSLPDQTNEQTADS